MATRNPLRRKGKARDAYLELVLEFPLVSIRTERQLQEAQDFMDRLFAQGKLNYGEESYLDALSDLVATYEDEHHAIEPAADADMLRHLMESAGVTQAQLSREAHVAKSTLCEILAGKKPFSRGIIRKLAEYFDVDVSVLASNP